MRLDKWLKTSRLIKRRSIAQMACQQGRVYVNDRQAKSAYEIKPGDTVHLELGSRAITVKVREVPAKPVRANESAALYELKEEITRPPEVLDWLPDGDI